MTDVSKALVEQEMPIEREGDEALLEVRNVVQTFLVKRRTGVTGGLLQAVSDISFDLRRGETLGVVGETGSGKSTLARTIVQAPPPQSGSVVFDGRELVGMERPELRKVRQQIQMIFQDPYSSVDPKFHVADIVEEPLLAAKVRSRSERRERVAELLDLVGLDFAVHGKSRARQLSGGQCQRVAIARALASKPAMIIADEPVSSLDVLVQAQVLSLFAQLRKELNLSYLFVAHDLALVKKVSDRVAVMYLGKFCEIGPADAIYGRPLHPYTGALLAAVPRPDPEAEPPQTDAALASEPPSPLNPPSGCRFRTRCPRAQRRCEEEVPLLRVVGSDAEHQVACHFPMELPQPSPATEGR